MRSLVGRTLLGLSSRSNTVIGVVATNARLDKAYTNRVAQMAQNGVVRTIRPVHTMHDGDTMFAMATGEKKADVNTIGLLGEAALIESVKRAVTKAKGFGIIPAYQDIVA